MACMKEGRKEGRKEGGRERKKEGKKSLKSSVRVHACVCVSVLNVPDEARQAGRCILAGVFPTASMRNYRCVVNVPAGWNRRSVLRDLKQTRGGADVRLCVPACVCVCVCVCIAVGGKEGSGREGRRICRCVLAPIEAAKQLR